MITINTMILSAIFGQKLNRFSNKLLIIEKICLKNYSIISYKTVMTSVINPLVICGPSGGGKSTLLNKLMDQFNDCFKFSISRKVFSQKKLFVFLSFHFIFRYDKKTKNWRKRWQRIPFY